jgi:hypothetical protein
MSFALRIGLGFVSLVVSHALLIVAHALNWYPENQIAKLLLSSPSAWNIEWVRWVLIAATTVLLWATADFLYRRREAWQFRSKSVPSQVMMADAVQRPFEADIDARSAFFQILESSQWRRDQDATTDPKNLVRDWREVRLSSEIHKALRNSRLAAWGEECLQGTSTTPEKPIPAETWDRVEIVFDRLSVPRTAAHFKGHISRDLGKMAWVGVKFSHAQILQLFPLEAKPSLDRIPVTDLFGIATRLGWDFKDRHSLHLIDLQDAMRQGGLDGHLSVWGRLNRWPNSEQLMRKEVIEKIPPDHWREFRVHLFGCLDNDNFNTYSWHVRPSASAERGYVDLHVERAQATEWLMRDAISYRGKSTLQNRG